MTEPLPDLWHSCDLPVLREAARRLTSRHAPIPLDEIEQALELTEKQVSQSARRLGTGEYVKISEGLGGVTHFNGLSAKGLREVGNWPTPETALDRMIAALEAIAKNTDAPEDDRTRARKALDGLAEAGRHIGLSVAAAAITGQLPT